MSRCNPPAATPRVRCPACPLGQFRDIYGLNWILGPWSTFILPVWRRLAPERRFPAVCETSGRGISTGASHRDADSAHKVHDHEIDNVERLLYSTNVFLNRCAWCLKHRIKDRQKHLVARLVATFRSSRPYRPITSTLSILLSAQRRSCAATTGSRSATHDTRPLHTSQPINASTGAPPIILFLVMRWTPIYSPRDTRSLLEPARFHLLHPL